MSRVAERSNGLAGRGSDPRPAPDRAPKPTLIPPPLDVAAARRLVGAPSPMSAPVVGDPRPIGRLAALQITTGLSQGFQARVPFHHLRWLDRVRELRSEMVASSDAEIRARIDASRERLQAGATLTSQLPEVFAAVREISRRTIGLEHYEVQLLAGMSLVDGSIAELKTGEGKTICAALAAVLFALDGQGCHVATTNRYLAERDAEKLRPVYEAVGLSVGVTLSTEQDDANKRSAYRSDITYGEAETFAFDWLNDQLVLDPEDRVQGELHAVIVDEADDVLLDSAQMPLILSGPADTAGFEHRQRDIALAQELTKDLDHDLHLRIDYEYGAKHPVLTEAGLDYLEAKCREALGASFELWTGDGALAGAILQAIQARFGFDKDGEYIGGEDSVVLVNDATGHAQPQSRWRDGLMEAVLQKEGREIAPPQLPLGEITYQNYFKRYGHLSGMTGTAKDGINEFREIYGLGVVQIPTHVPSQRIDEDDRFFPHPALALMAVAADAAESKAQGRAVLIATTSVGESKHVGARLRDVAKIFAEVALSSPALLDQARTMLDANGVDAPSLTELADRFRAHAEATRSFAELLERRGVPATVLCSHLGSGLEHRVLNAETLKDEAEIIAAAGQRGAITVATQVAGRGIDIPLDASVEAAGGLRVIGLGHQTNARKDEQVAGRAGRQGKRGSAQFYVSPADRLFSFLPARQVRKLCVQSESDDLSQLPASLRRAWIRAVAKAQDTAEGLGRQQRKENTELDAVVQKQREAIEALKAEVGAHPDPEQLLRDWLPEDQSMPRETEAELARLEKQALAGHLMNRAQLQRYLRRIIVRSLNLAWVEYQESLTDVRAAVRLRSHAQKKPAEEFVRESSKLFMSFFGSLTEELAKLRPEAIRELASRAPLPARTEAAA